MWLSRSLGINLHPTSLPGGRLGPEAYAFVDWLAAAEPLLAGVPLNPPDDHGSPYASVSAFAAGRAARGPRRGVEPSELRARSRRENAYWIGDWVDFAGGDALAEQVRFHREWSALRGYAAERGVRLVGDVPIYVAAGSCDHVAHPGSSFRRYVAGAPPDPLNELGQKWGNPLYDWEALARRATAGGPSGCAGCSASSTPSGSTTSAASPATGRCRRGDGPRRPLDAGPGAAVFRAPSTSSARCP